MKNIFFLFVFCFPIFIQSQSLTGSELLEKSIQYHDPNGNWATFSAKLNFEGERPKSQFRDKTIVKIDLPNQYFQATDYRGENVFMREVVGEDCNIKLNNKSEIPEEKIKTFRLTCDRAKMFRNYYTYLYGLPMKLKDPGTNIDKTVKNDSFQNQECHSIRVTYDEAVGKDIWYFYFDKKSYALIGYRFYHDESKNDGEYIILKEKEEVAGIKIPKIRHWYYNSDDKFLGADYLMSGETFSHKVQND